MQNRTEYKNKWQSENCERISLVVKKGKKEVIAAHAQSKGESLNSFVNRAIDNQMERDKGDGQ